MIEDILKYGFSITINPLPKEWEKKVRVYNSRTYEIPAFDKIHPYVLDIIQKIIEDLATNFGCCREFLFDKRFTKDEIENICSLCRIQLGYHETGKHYMYWDKNFLILGWEAEEKEDGWHVDFRLSEDDIKYIEQFYCTDDVAEVEERLEELMIFVINQEIGNKMILLHLHDQDQPSETALDVERWR